MKNDSIKTQPSLKKESFLKDFFFHRTSSNFFLNPWPYYYLKEKKEGLIDARNCKTVAQ